jgi:tetratricopeptide (TPR) repeat protein
MDSPNPTARREVKPWVVFAAVGAAVVIFAGIWLVVGNRKLDRQFGAVGRPKASHGKEWNRANTLCRRLNMAGNSYAVAGMYDSALSCYREALRIAEKQANTERMAASYQNISNVFDYKHLPESVRFYMNAAIALNRLSRRPNRAVGDLFEEGTFRFNSLGDVDSGKVLLEKALVESRKRGNRWTEAAALNNLGLLQATLKRYDSARVLFESCAAVGRVIKDRATEAGAFHNLALLYMRRDRLDAARPWLLKTIEVAHAGELVGEEASALFDMALIRAEDGEYEIAQLNVEQAMKLFERAGDNGGVNRCRYFLDELIEAQRWKHRVRSLDSLFERRRSEPDQGM